MIRRIITLTTDFGLSEPFVGVMKGQILIRYPDANIVDLTHSVTAHWPAEAGFWLAHSYRYFPSGSVHVAVVDPGVGSQRSIVCVEADDHVFLAPDNGLLANVVARARSPLRLYRVDLNRLAHLGLGAPSATFHGRDIFAPLAAELAAGRLRPSDLGEVITKLVPCAVAPPIVEAKRVVGVIVTLDHFGNLISNIDASLFTGFETPRVRAGDREFALHRTYADARPGEYLALINSVQTVEIARVEQSAALGLGLGRGAPIEVVDVA